MTWTHLIHEPTATWFDTTPYPSLIIHAATELGAIADRLARRAVEILAPPTTHATRVLEAVSTLLADSHGHDGECRITPDEIAWATTRGGALHIIEHTDGSVTFTKRHRDDCVFITSAGAQACPDDGCLFEDPYPTSERRPGR
jgi:hypothetical protein